jgi:Kelch motif
MLGTDLILFSGFSGDYSFVTDKTFAYDTASGTENKTWREMDPIPEPIGITHAGHVFKNKKIYACGGYIGGNDYPAGSDCFLYNHKSPRGSQWSMLPSLPEKRSGGGMIYDSKRNSLIYATGAYRHSWVGDQEIVDRNNVWELHLGNLSEGWINKTSIPYIANHVGFTTVRLLNGNERHFFLGGQQGQLESGGNFDAHYEYVASTDTWIERQPMPFGRGHFSSSVVNYRHCGYFIAAGATNFGNYEKTADISFYSLEYDNWTHIGNLPFALNSPVCAISGEYYYCQSGWVNSPYSFKRKII